MASTPVVTSASPRVTVIIPTLNEAENLPHVLFGIPGIGEGTEVVLVDGHSTDNTVEVAKKLRPDIRILYQPGKGKGDALRYGFKHAQGDIIVTLDADGSFNPGEMGEFIKPLLNGYQFAKGSRFLPGGGTLDMSLHRRIANRMATILVNILYGSTYTDLAYGYHAFQKKALEGMEIRSEGFEIDTEIYLKVKKAGLKVIEVPSFENKRIGGKGKLRSLKDGPRILITILRERFRE